MRRSRKATVQKVTRVTGGVERVGYINIEELGVMGHLQLAKKCAPP